MNAVLRRWRLGLALAVVLGLAAAGWMARAPIGARLRNHPYFVVSQISVHGVGPALTPDDVTAWLGFNAHTTVWEASPGRVRARLEAHPYIATAAVRRIFPGRLEIVVREREPQAIAVLDQLYYVDRSGAVFGPLRADDPRNLPIVTGLDPDAAVGARNWMLRRALRLLRRCERAATPPTCAGPLSEVHVDARDGLTVFPTTPRVPLVLGWGSWTTKLARAGRALRAWEGDAARLARLDLRFRNQVVATTRPAPAPAPAPAAAKTRKRGRGLKA
jgi:cell division protein FtsQ